MTRNTSLITDLKTRRETLGWSIDELGDRSGIDETFLGDWERGLGSPRLEAVQQWAGALGLALELVSTEKESRQGLRVDWEKHCIKVDGTPVRLTPMEWKALERLARAPGELVTHQALFRHLYGDDRQHRAQSTAIRVLITKLRRLLPVRIEAHWGQGYVLTGLAPSSPTAHNGHSHGNGVSNVPVEPQPAVAKPLCDRMVLPEVTPPEHLSAPQELVEISQPAMRRVAVAPLRIGPRRAEELGVIERFLAERGVTRCPDVATIQHAPLPTLIWDKVKRKWVRPSSALP